MAIFISILEGASPQAARPLLASSDPALIAMICRELFGRLGNPGDMPQTRSKECAAPRKRKVRGEERGRA